MEFSKEYLNELSSLREKTEKKSLSFSNESSSGSIISPSNFLDLYELSNNLKLLNNNQIIKSKENYDRDINGQQLLDIKNIRDENNNINNNTNNNITILGKKTKNIFDMKKITRKKRTLSSEKILNPNQDIKDVCPKKDLFRTFKYTYWDDPNKNSNGGRWSYEEHIRFIESFVNHGKNWIIIQKHIGTRSAGQIRSHAQKFFLRLKELIANKFGFSLSKHNIKSLLDLINLIGMSNKANKNRKEYVINILITLTKMNQENNGKRYFEGKKGYFKTEIKKEKMVNDKDYDSLNKINNDNKELKFDDLISGIDSIKYENEDDEDIFANIKSNLEESNININKNNNLLDLKEINVNKNTDIINYERNNNNNCKYFNNKKNQDFIGNDNNSFLLSDASDICSIDKASIEPINNLFEKNIKSTFLKFIN